MNECFLVTINCYVHVIMYLYYFLALFEGINRRIIKVKPYVTLIQMVNVVCNIFKTVKRELIELILFKGLQLVYVSGG